MTEEHFDTFCVDIIMTLVYELAYTEEAKKKEEEIKKMTIFNFFERRFLHFYKADLKSEAIFVLRKARAFRRYLVC